MRVIFNTLATLKAKTGVGHYAARLADKLRCFTDIATFPSSGERFASGGDAGGARPRAWSPKIAGSLLSFPLKSAARAAVGSWFFASHTPAQFDLYHEPNFLPFPSRLPTVITVHDLSVLLHPEWHPADRVRRHERAFRKAVRDSIHIVTVSTSVRRELMATLNVPESKVTAVHNGVGPEFFAAKPDEAVRRRLNLPERYLLYVGTIEPRKNLLTLLKAWSTLPSDVRSACPLVLAGGWGWKADEVADYFSMIARPRGAMHLGYVADGDRPALYAGARALAFPSHYEGFGLPPLEMLAAGGAVLASTARAHREVLGCHAHFVEATDVDGWRSALLRAATDNAWLAEMREDGRDHAKQFTWHHTARATAAVYQSLAPLRQAA